MVISGFALRNEIGICRLLSLANVILNSPTLTSKLIKISKDRDGAISTRKIIDWITYSDKGIQFPELDIDDELSSIRNGNHTFVLKTKELYLSRALRILLETKSDDYIKIFYSILADNEAFIYYKGNVEKLATLQFRRNLEYNLFQVCFRFADYFACELHNDTKIDFKDCTKNDIILNFRNMSMSYEYYAAVKRIIYNPPKGYVATDMELETWHLCNNSWVFSSHAVYYNILTQTIYNAISMHYVSLDDLLDYEWSKHVSSEQFMPISRIALTNAHRFPTMYLPITIHFQKETKSLTNELHLESVTKMIKPCAEDTEKKRIELEKFALCKKWESIPVDTKPTFKRHPDISKEDVMKILDRMERILKEEIESGTCEELKIHYKKDLERIDEARRFKIAFKKKKDLDDLILKGTENPYIRIHMVYRYDPLHNLLKQSIANYYLYDEFIAQK